MNEITDEALLAFAKWCRLNHGQFVYDPAVLRRVFDAYASLDPLTKVLDAHADVSGPT